MTTPRGLANPGAALAALERAVAEVRQQYGDGARRVGRRAPLPVWRHRSAGRWRAPGGTACFAWSRSMRRRRWTRVAGHVGPGQPLAGFGDAWVLLVHFTRPVTAWSVLAYGQTTDLESPHSRDQIRLFANHQLRPVWFSEEAIAANSSGATGPVERQGLSLHHSDSKDR